jgi:hypothetical protein
LPHSSAEHGAFALPDQTGTRLIATAGIPHAEGVHKALCGDGRSVVVQYDHRQIERKDNNGRQVPANFDKLGGDVFRVAGATVSVEATCFLTGSGWIDGATVVSMRAENKQSGCGNGVETRFAEVKSRAVIRCFPLKVLEDGTRIVLAEFARTGTHALASVAVIAAGRLLFGDYPAEVRAGGADLWRVDDGGKLSPEGFDIVFVAQREGRLALAVSWAGTEGRALTLFVSDTGNELKRVLGDYWYQMPE